MLTKLDIRSSALRQDESGAVLAWFALSLPVLVIAAAFVINFAKWFEDKRHLQTQVDAAALAGGLSFGAPCDDPSIASSALQYSGDTYRAVTAYNTQPSDPSNVHVVLNQTAYWKSGDPTIPAGAYGDLGAPCATAFLDVKATHDAPSFFLSGLVPNGVLPAIHAHARVDLETLTGEGALPVAVPQPTPLERACLLRERGNRRFARERAALRHRCQQQHMRRRVLDVVRPENQHVLHGVCPHDRRGGRLRAGRPE